jgi:hypothetical protein
MLDHLVPGRDLELAGRDGVDLVIGVAAGHLLRATPRDLDLRDGLAREMVLFINPRM